MKSPEKVVKKLTSFCSFRCATGEAWPDIMLDAVSGRECDPTAVELNETTV